MQIQRRDRFGPLVLAIWLTLFDGLALAAPTATKPTAARVEAPAIVRPVNSGVKEISPREDGWETEVFFEAADAQLKTLVKLLATPAKLDAAAIAKVADVRFSCKPLRPLNLKEIYRDAALVVRRLPDQPRAENKTDTGPAGLASALAQLIEPAAGAVEQHVKTKIFRVDKTGGGKTGGGVATHVYFQLGAQLKGRSLQINATWLCDWSYEVAKTKGASSPAPRLRAIELLNYEQVDGTTSGGPMLADCTKAVLGANVSFDDQLLPGMDHWTGTIDVRFGLGVGGWHGLAIGDVNGDGLEDVYFCQPGGLPNRLFVQNPDGTATDVSAASGVDVLDGTQAALFVDLDNDDDQDLVQSVDDGVLIMANDGRGRFTVRAAVPLPAAIPYS
ncbi:MAG: VCBS repeat-containing protein, partial [Pirellulales bacterium]